MDDAADFSGGYKFWIAPNGQMSLHATSEADAWYNIVQVSPNWTFYALTSDGTTRRFYVNGVLQGAKNISSPLRSDGDDPFVMGAVHYNGNFNFFFKGALDDIRIFQRALSASEVESLGPPPSIEVSKQPAGYRIGLGESVTLSVIATVVPAGGTLSYQWEENQVQIAKATNSTLAVVGTTGTNRYRVLLKAGAIQRYSDEVAVVTVLPSDGRLLLRLDFEEVLNGSYVDSALGMTGIVGNATLVPGRVGSFAANFNGSSFIRIPAAGTDLELVGTTYTIAWWMKTRTPPVTSSELIYTLGSPAQNLTGYGARLEGLSTTRTLRTDHRNGVSPSTSSPFRTSTNWQHVAIVYTGVSRTIYTNGVVAGTPLATGFDIIGSGLDDLFLGAESETKFSAIGALDDFRIYNYSLATDEIQALYNIPPPAIRLSLASSGGELTLTWPIVDDSQYRIEYATELPAIQWFPVSATIQSSGSFYQVKVPAPANSRFYRVRKL
jgi:hypothetical protein